MTTASHTFAIEDLVSGKTNVHSDLVKAAINAMPDHVSILDAKGRILYVNEAWIKYAVFNQLNDPDFGVGKYYCETCKPAVQNGESDAVIVYEALENILNKKSGDRFSYEYICPHPLDSKHDRWFLLQLIPFYMQNDLHVLASHKDITTRKNIEHNRDLLDAAITQSRSGVMITDTMGDIIYVNHGFTVITGYEASEVMGKNPRILRSGIVSPRLYSELWEAIKAGKTWRGVLCNSRKNGNLYWEEMTITPVKDRSGMATHYVAVKEDVTESRNNARLLLEAQKMEGIGMIASGLAHDFNNLLFMISMSTYLAQSSDGQEINTHLENIKAITKQGAAITRALSMVNRRTNRSLEKTSVNDHLTAIAPLLRLLLGKKISLDMKFDSDGSWVNVDISEFNNAIINLVANARDAVKKNGVVVIEANNFTSSGNDCQSNKIPQGNYVKISVSDNGVGMPKEILEHALNPLFTTKAEGKGTGLGLFTVDNFCVQHKGCFSIDSELGAGTVVKMILPVA